MNEDKVNWNQVNIKKPLFVMKSSQKVVLMNGLLFRDQQPALLYSLQSILHWFFRQRF